MRARSQWFVGTNSSTNQIITQSTMKTLLQQIGRCDMCLPHLSHGVRPMVQASSESKILIIGQAPGRKVHEFGVPWDDPSGDQLRQWLGVGKNEFYDEGLFALMPMGFCYPGKGKSGDLPPRKECAPKWHTAVLSEMSSVKLTLLIGQYAQNHYLPNSKKTLTENVINFDQNLPQYFPLPHPSPRNRFWQTKNPWFNTTVVPELSQRIQLIFDA